MESTESSYVSSPEAHAKRSPAPVKPLPMDPTENPTYIRFLVSNPLAGAVIGKGGSTITDFQSQSGARIQLSRSNEYFPGTTDRIIMISGTIDETLKAVDLVLDKLLTELHAEDGDDVGPRTKVRLIVPNGSCGSIIGKGGAIIKSFIEESQAGIKISPLDHNYYGLTDRLVTLTGTLDEQMRAIELILAKLSEDAHYSQTMTVPFSYAGVFFSGFHGLPYAHVAPPVPAAPHNAVHYGPNMAGRKFQNNKVHPLPYYLNLISDPNVIYHVYCSAKAIICHFSLSIYEEIRLLDVDLLRLSASLVEALRMCAFERLKPTCLDSQEVCPSSASTGSNAT